MSNPHAPELGAAGLPRPVKYLALAVLLPALGFTTMAVLTPAVAGAHDGGFMGMMLGLFLAQVAFAYVLVPRHRLLGAAGVFTAASLVAWGATGVLAENAAALGLPPYPPFGTQADQRLWAFIYFALLCVGSAGSWEVAYRLIGSRR